MSSERTRVCTGTDARDPLSARSITTEWVMRGKDYLAFAALATLNVLVMAYFLLYWLSLGDWRQQPVLFSFVTILILIVLANYEGRWLMLLFMKRPVPRPWTSRPRVGVATTFVPDA